MTKGDLEEESGRGDRIDWFQGGCPELRKMERCSAKNCGRNGVNPPSLLRGQYRIKTELLPPVNSHLKAVLLLSPPTPFS